MDRPEEEGTLGVVAAAAKVAAAKALDSPEARRQHLRVILLSCCVTVTVVAVIALPMVILLDRERRSAALDRARFNCQQHAETVKILEEDLEGGIELREESRRLTRQPQIQGVFIKLFGRTVVEDYYVKLGELEEARTRDWRTNLLPRLRALADTDCKEVLKVGGVNTTPAAPSRTTTGTKTTRTTK